MNKVSQKQSKELIKKEEREDKIERMQKVFTQSMDFSDSNIGELLDLIEKKKLTQREEKRKNELHLEISKANALKNGLWAANLSYGKYHKFLYTTRSLLVKEYDCKTSIELMLADRIVASYWRSMKYDMFFNRLIEKEDGGYSFDQLKVNVLKEFNKGLEIANRQLNASIIFLKELKQPRLNVRVTTDNAYIAQNQQVNVVQKKENENNDPK